MVSLPPIGSRSNHCFSAFIAAPLHVGGQFQQVGADAQSWPGRVLHVDDEAQPVILGEQPDHSALGAVKSAASLMVSTGRVCRGT